MGLKFQETKTKFPFISLLAFSFIPLLPVNLAAQSVSGIPTDTQRGVLSFAPLIKEAGPTVVRVVRFAAPQPLDPNKGAPSPSSSGGGVDRREGTGSGAVINAREGLIVTNAHVVDGGARFEVQFSDGKILAARLVGKDDATDIALLKVAPDGLRQIDITNSDQVMVGDLVFAIGHPMGLDQTLTMGIVSGLGRSGIGDGLEDYIQTDAPINPGNSGGPLIDSRARLIGVNTAILSRSGGNVGIGFAVPARMVLAVVDQLVRFGEVRRGRIGVSTTPLTDTQARTLGLTNTQGAFVSAVDAGSPAQSAGLRAGDIIISAQNRPVTSPGVFAAIIGIATPGSNIDLSYRRDGQVANARVTVQAPRALVVTDNNGSGESPATTAGKGAGGTPALPPSTQPRGQSVLGARYRNVVPADRLPDGTVGAYIDGVASGSPADRRGLRAGDVVVSVNRVQIISAAEMTRQLANAGTQAAQVVVLRNGNFVPLTLAE
jgi:S1-C subfamily serine protease